MHQKKSYYYLLLLFAMPLCAHAANLCPESLAEIISFQGKVDIQNPNEYNWRPLEKDYTFCFGDKIRTSKNSRATLKFKNGPSVTLDQNSTLTFSVDNKKKSSWITDLIKGSAFFRSRQQHSLPVRSPWMNVVHKGTEFLVTVDAEQTKVTVFDGQVAASNAKGEVLVEKGFTGIAGKAQAPHVQALTIRPEDAVQWSLYYPPIIEYRKTRPSESASLQSSINANLQNNPYKALTLMNAVPASQHNAEYLTLKSSLLLMFGSVEEAIKLIDQALVLEPDNSTAIALQSIIAVTKNRQDKALSLAQKASKHDPKSAVAQIALSYAYQSKFDIESALKTTQEAIRLSPDNALAWARLSELQLSTGEREGALKSAERAKALNPRLGRTQTILGFANLAQVEIDEAKAAFNQAINLDSADPLAHLGLGLAKIRKGDIEEGTGDLETAVSLDPDNAIMRSYLGKAYYELKNDDYAATELTIAKEKDPSDPTPWFYDAIRKQTTNRPVEALHDMQKAIELNDNRGIYRSKLLLDEDAAARSANMARIYQDLGFDRVALKQAWTSLGQDYTNPSAHRFLSDTLQGRPRQRIARASELLQAQLFQPINTVPVQPQLTSENISILNSTGPGSLSSNEYDPLFTSNGAHILLNGAYGSNNTLTDNAIITGLYDQFSVSFGQFHFQTDGFRVNDDYKQNIYNAFAQIAVTPDLNLQVEFKREDVTAGDVPLRFNRFHKIHFRESIDQDTARFGLRYKINSEQDFVISASTLSFEENEQDQTREIFSSTPTFDIFAKTNRTINVNSSGYQLESQFSYQPELFSLIAGFGYLDLKDQVTENETGTLITINRNTGQVFPEVPNPILKGLRTSTPETHHFNAYTYSQFEVISKLTNILGISFDSYEKGKVNQNKFNPKFGAIWKPIEQLTIRSAVFRTLKKPLVSNQTIELSQVAGFNQFFDENNGATAWNYGIGLDFQPLNNLYLGGEFLIRDTIQPILTTSNVLYQGRDEASHLAYIYWAPLNWFSINTEYHFDEFRREFTSGNVDQTNPRSIQTHFVPIKLNFFHKKGVFSNLTASYVNQKAEYVLNNGPILLSGESNDFWTFDVALGYRLPNKFGSFSLEVRNLFDNKGFKYNSVFDASGPQLSQFTPEREVFLKLNLTY